MTWKLAALLILLFNTSIAVAAQSSHAKPPIEQSKFAMEGVVIAHPVDLPEKALPVLRRSRAVLECLEEDHSIEDIPANWFVASVVHLGGPKEIDLVVQARDLTANYTDRPTPNACLYYTKSMPFWVLRKTSNGYVLVLEANALVLRVLDSRSNGFRDIETSLVDLAGQTKFTFKFNGRHYKLSRRHDIPYE
jgi:hypothetical protein